LNVTSAGTLDVRGGTGANSSGLYGGGGGGGGRILVAYDATGTLIDSATVQKSGGTQGATGSGVPTPGADGTYDTLRLTRVVLAETYTYSIDWNDGSAPDTGSATIDIPASLSNPASASFDGMHTYDDNGNYTVNVTVTDSNGNSDTKSFQVLVKNVAPTATLSNDGPVDENSTVYVTFTNQFDPSAADTTAGFLYSYDVDNDGVFEITASSSPSATVPASYLDDGPGLHTVRARIADKDGGINDYTTMIAIQNVNPTATLSNSGPVVEGSSALVSFGNQFDPSSADTLAGFSYSYDFNNDGTFEITGSSSASATVPASFLLDGPATRTVRGRIADKDGGFNDYLTMITIQNAAPVVQSLTTNSHACGQVAAGGQVTIAAIFTDAGILDTHTATIEWGDGTMSAGVVTQGSGSGSIAASHVYPTSGLYMITVTLIDDDGGSAQRSVTTATAGSGAEVVGGVLRIIGTDGDDKVHVNQQGDGTFKVHADFLTNPDKVQTFSGTGVTLIHVILCGGNDQATIAGSITVPAILDGGPGNDKLNGGGGSNILIGGDGDDTLVGGPVRDLMIGGRGEDRIVGNAGDDIIIGGPTSYDSNAQALLAILAEWNSSRKYSERVNNISNGPVTGVPANGGYYLKVGPTAAESTVFDDGAHDVLTGSAGTDWFFADLDGNNKDKITDLSAIEFQEELDFIYSP
jgi:hypothetical protein